MSGAPQSETGVSRPGLGRAGGAVALAVTVIGAYLLTWLDVGDVDGLALTVPGTAYLALSSAAALGLVALLRGWRRTAVAAWIVALVVLALPVGNIALILGALLMAGGTWLPGPLVGGLVLGTVGIAGAVLALLSSVRLDHESPSGAREAVPATAAQTAPGQPGVLGETSGRTATSSPTVTAPAATRPNTLAVVSVVLGVLTGLPGAVLGHIALQQTRTSGERGRGYAIAGIAVGYTFFLGGALLLVNAIASIS